MHISRINFCRLHVSFFSFHCSHIIVFCCYFLLHLVALIFKAHFFHALLLMFFVSTIVVLCLYFVRISSNIYVLFNAHFMHELLQAFCCFLLISLFLHHFLCSTTRWFFLDLTPFVFKVHSSMHHFFFCFLFQQLHCFISISCAVFPLALSLNFFFLIISFSSSMAMFLFWHISILRTCMNIFSPSTYFFFSFFIHILF